MHFLPAKGRVMYFRKLSRFAGVSEASAERESAGEILSAKREGSLTFTRCLR